MHWLYLLVGSAAGGGARYVLSGITHKYSGHGFPYGTLLVNLLGCFLIGVLYWIAEEKAHLNQASQLLLMTGFCGAFTTFSTFMLDISKLIKVGSHSHAFFYISGSFVLGYLSFLLGLQIIRVIYPA